MKLLRNPFVATPMVVGLLKPAIVIPDRDFDDDQLRNIFLHEAAHLRQFDIAIKWLILIASSIHWFNPVMLLIKKEINHACELACDEAVIKNLDDNRKQAYGDTLISIASTGKYPIGVLQATMSEDKKNLKDRLISIMKHKRKSKLIMMISLALLIAIIAGAVALGAGVGFGSKLPPSLYIGTEFNSTKTAVTGSYHWFHGKSKNYREASSLHEFQYRFDNTVSIKEGGQLILNTEKSKIDNKYGFTLSQYSVYKDYQPYLFDTPEPIFMPDSLYLQAPSEPGEYTYSVTLDFGNKGVVEYGFAVSVNLPLFNLEEMYKHKTSYIGDNNKVSALVSLLPLPDPYYKQRFISLKTDESPYGLTVYYEPATGNMDSGTLPMAQARLEVFYIRCASVLFDMIENMDEVTFALRNTPSDDKLVPTEYDETFRFQRAELAGSKDMASIKREISAMEELLDYNFFEYMTHRQISEELEKLPEIIRDNYDGLGRIYNGNGYMLLSRKEGKTRLPADTTSYALSPAETTKEHIVLEDAEGNEICRFPLGMNVQYYRDTDLLLVAVKENPESVMPSIVNRIFRIAGHQLTGDEEFIGRAKEAQMRGSSLFDPGKQTYISADIRDGGRDFSEYVVVYNSFVEDITNKLSSSNYVSLDKIKAMYVGISLYIDENQQYSLGLLDDGTKVVMERGGSRKAWVDSQVYDNIIDVVKAKTKWSFVSLSDIHDIETAILHVKESPVTREKVQVLEDQDSIKKIEAAIANAEYIGISGCPFDAELMLFPRGRDAIIVQIATDGCDTMILGSSMGYSFKSASELFKLFDQTQIDGT